MVFKIIFKFFVTWAQLYIHGEHVPHVRSLENWQVKRLCKLHIGDFEYGLYQIV